MPYRLFADAVLFLHFAVVVFVVGGLVCILVGNFRHWHWVNSFGFRIAHLAVIGIVVVQGWQGKICPLTVLEGWLREQAGETFYGGSFIEYWFQRAMYFEAPPWLFAVVYTMFGLLVLATWWYFPPRRNRRPSA